LLTESVLLSLIGGAAGLALADGTFGLILRLGGDRLPRSGLVIDHAVLWFTLALSVLAGIFFGMVPAFRVAHGHGAEELGEGRSFTAGVGRVRLRSAGVISFSVSQRTHEIGVRMALGARLGQVQWMVVRAALKTVLIGLAVGGGISLLPSRLISSRSSA
jgi:ABC-type antimicrobial peptide transport system permease subunit